MEEILVDENGYNQYLAEIEKLKQSNIKNLTMGSEAYNDAVGDGWHDNFAFEESMRENTMISKRIEDLLQKRKYIKIIKNEKNDDCVNIGDIVEIEIRYSKGDIELEKIMLTGNYFPDTDNEIQEITLNSPLGKALFKSKIGDSTYYYVGKLKILVTILSKVE